MSRLPVVGGDSAAWGTILNDYLGVAHNPDGTLKDPPLYMNPKLFGAVGDGSADDYAGLTAAIAALPTGGTSVGGVVMLPFGSYKISQPLVIPTKVTLRGIARSSVFISPHSTFPRSTTAGTINLASLGAGIAVTNASAFPSSGAVYCGGHTFIYTGKSGNTLTGVTSYLTSGTIASGTAIAPYLVWQGHPITPTGGVNDCVIQDISIGCGNIPGVGGIFSNRAQEGSGLKNVLVQNFLGTGIRYTYMGVGTTIGQYVIEQFYLLAGGAADANVDGIWIDENGGGGMHISGGTIVNNDGTNTGGSAIKLDGCLTPVRDVHVEHFAVGLNIAPNASCLGLRVDDFRGGGGNVRLVKIAAGDNHYTLTNLVQIASTYILDDAQYGILSAASEISLHARGGGSSVPNMLVSDLTRGVVVMVKAGAITDADFPAPIDGCVGIDSTNHRFYVRYGGGWHYTALT